MEQAMSLGRPAFDRVVIVRAQDAEEIAAGSARVQLLADSSATGGALSTVRVTLESGADGARPHRHDRAAEMFYVLDGSLRARGVKFEEYDTPGLKTKDGIATAGGAKSAWFKDTEGNIMAIVQSY
jgi:uncharacterized cupin superfamily protein